MARKKFLEDRNDEGTPQKGPKHGGTIQMHQGQGGGTKTRKSTDQKYNDDSFLGVKKQLAAIGLTIREMPGDGNCLFRALSDQLSGNARNHLEYRRAVVQYMKDNRSDFEPFVEDDVPFDKYINTLAQAGTFAGNDAIVAFSRLQNVTVVIHQLNSPAWLIHPSNEPNQCSGREVHIAYHNGDHYNSVRILGDDSENPTNIKLRLSQGATAEGKPNYKSPGKPSSPNKGRSESLPKTRNSSTSVFESYDPGVAYGNRDEDYWVKDSADVDRLVEDVMAQTDYPDAAFVRDTLLDFNFDIAATVDFILSMSFVMSQQEKDNGATGEKLERGPTRSSERNVKDKSPEASYPSQALLPAKKQVTDMDEQLEDIGESESNSSKGDESDENRSSPTQETEASQNKPSSSSHKEVRLNGRRKKELKKRERKREAEARKKRTPSTDADSKENVVVVSSLGSLDI